MNLYLSNIYGRLIELSDIALQRKIWLNEDNDTGKMSSYAELINSLFDDYGFDQFLDKEAIEWGVPSNIVEQLDGVRSMLNVYIDRENKKPRTERQILSDPEWLQIVDRTKEIMNKWDYKNP